MTPSSSSIVYYLLMTSQSKYSVIYFLRFLCSLLPLIFTTRTTNGTIVSCLLLAIQLLVPYHIYRLSTYSGRACSCYNDLVLSCRRTIDASVSAAAGAAVAVEAASSSMTDRLFRCITVKWRGCVTVKRRGCGTFISKLCVIPCPGPKALVKHQ